MKKLIYFLISISTTVYSQLPWTPKDGYQGVSMEKGFQVDVYDTYYNNNLTKRIKNKNVFSGDYKKGLVKRNLNNRVKIYFDFLDKKITFYDYNKKTYEYAKIKKIRKKINSFGDEGKFYIKSKKGKVTYYFYFDNRSIHKNNIFYMITKINKNKKIEYSPLLSFYHRPN